MCSPSIIKKYATTKHKTDVVSVQKRMEYAKFSSLLWQSIIALYHKVFIDVDFYMSVTPTFIFFGL